jgi:hypothetical protein
MDDFEPWRLLCLVRRQKVGEHEFWLRIRHLYEEQGSYHSRSGSVDHVLRLEELSVTYGRPSTQRGWRLDVNHAYRT